VGRRTNDGAGHGQVFHIDDMRDTEVHQFQDAVGANHDVFRLHVAMNDTVFVGVLKSSGHDRGHHGGHLGQKRPVHGQKLRQRHPVHEFGYDQGVIRAVASRIVSAFTAGKIVDLYYVLVFEFCDNAGLAAEPLAGVGTPEQVRMHDLDRHRSIQRQIHSAINDSHAATSNLVIDFVSVEICAAHRQTPGISGKHYSISPDPGIFKRKVPRPGMMADRRLRLSTGRRANPLQRRLRAVLDQPPVLNYIRRSGSF